MPDIYYNAGLAYYYKGEYKSGSFYKSNINFPEYTEAYGAMAMAYRDMGNSKLAINTIMKAIKINPDYAGGYNILGNCLKTTRTRKSDRNV